MFIKRWRRGSTELEAEQIGDEDTDILETIGLTDIDGNLVYRFDILEVVRQTWRSPKPGSIGMVFYEPENASYWIRWADLYECNTNFDKEFIKACRVVGNYYDGGEIVGMKIKERDSGNYDRVMAMLYPNNPPRMENIEEDDQ